jgi:hypothetical protein
MLAAPKRLGSIRVPRVVLGVSPKQSFPAGRRKLHAGTHALPEPTSKPWLLSALFENDL